MPDAVVVDRLTHRYDERTALDGISLTVPAGQLFGLVGPNGGGKSTLFRILSTLLRPTSGTARVAGLDPQSDGPAVRRLLGVVFQQPALDDELTVKENLQVHAALYGLSRRDATDRILHLADSLQLTDRLKDRAGTLSGGLRRRADLCRGLLHRPQVLLLDEPTTGLDPAARHAFWTTLAQLRETEGTTLLLATHLLDEAERCDQVGLLDAGRLAALGAPDDLRAALGEETLWLTTDRPEVLSTRIAARFEVVAQTYGGQVQVSHPEAHKLLPAIFEAFGSQIQSATVRRPTLEDVFLVHTGHAVTAHAPLPPSTA